MAELWMKWTNELFLLMFRRGISESLSEYAKVCRVFLIHQSFVCDIGEQLLSDIQTYRRDIEPEIRPSKNLESYFR